MKTAFFIGWRYQRARQKNHFVSLISLFSTIGIALGVMVLILGLSAMNGFERELKKRILAVVPHAEISAYQEYGKKVPINQWENLTALLTQDPQIVATSPFVSFTALIENGTTLKVVQVKGVESSHLEKVSALGDFVLDSGWKKFTEQGGLILGAGIAKELGVNAGDWVTLLVSQATETNQLAQPMRHSLPVTAILRLEGQLDHSYALMPMRLAQQFLNYSADQVSGIDIRVKDPFAVQELEYAMLQNYPQVLYANNWIATFGYMYRDIQLIRTVMYIAMVLVIGVACFNIVSTLIMAVKDKQGDIAILRTLGANNHFIRQIFIWYGLQAGMKGCLIGVLLGIVFALNLTQFIQGIEFLLGKKLLSDGVYFVDFLPSELHWQDVLLVLFAALILSLLASLYPANRATKLQPAQVLSGH